MTGDGHRVRLTEQDAQADLRILLELCAAGDLRCSEKTGRPAAASIATVRSHLTHGDFYQDDAIASFAWPLLLQAGALARIESGRLRLTAKGRAALDQPAPDVIRVLWQRWLTHAVIDEFSRIEGIKGQRARNVLTAAKPRRAVVAQALAQCPANEWIGVDALFPMMRRHQLNPTIARSEMALWKLYLVDGEYGSLGYDGYYRWEMVEGRYTLAVLFEYAATMGLLDVEYVLPSGARDDFRDNWGGDAIDALSRYDGLRAIRLNALGRYAVGLTDSYAPPTTSGSIALKVLPNLDIVATGKATVADELLLSAYATRTGDHVWTVSAASLLDATEAGRSLTTFLDFLTQHSENELPPAFSSTVHDVIRRAAHVTDLGHHRVLECADATIAALITHDPTTRSLCRSLGSNYIAVPLDVELKFRNALRRLGYTI